MWWYAGRMVSDSQGEENGKVGCHDSSSLVETARSCANAAKEQCAVEEAGAVTESSRVVFWHLAKWPPLAVIPNTALARTLGDGTSLFCIQRVSEQIL